MADGGGGGGGGAGQLGGRGGAQNGGDDGAFSGSSGVNLLPPGWTATNVANGGANATSGGSGQAVITYRSASGAPLFTGGTITTNSGVVTHTFTESDVLFGTTTVGRVTLNVTMIGGGGGGGNNDENGRGYVGYPGSQITGTITVNLSDTIQVGVGSGGENGHAGGSGPGGNGGSSVIGSASGSTNEIIVKYYA